MMTILGPLAALMTSALTDTVASLSASEVTVVPSTWERPSPAFPDGPVTVTVAKLALIGSLNSKVILLGALATVSPSPGVIDFSAV